MKAKDLMIPLVEYLTPDNSLTEAVHMLKRARRGEKQIGVKALPVLEKSGNLAGILSIGDILKAVYPSYMYLMDLGEFAWDGMVEAFAQKATRKKVKDLMSHPVITVREESTLMECIDHMLKHEVKRVPVLNNENRVTGMLYERDVFYAIADAMARRQPGRRHGA
jgi:CBS domain-containing protein